MRCSISGSFDLLTFCVASYKEKRPQLGSPWWRSAPVVWNQTHTDHWEETLTFPYHTLIYAILQAAAHSQGLCFRGTFPDKALWWLQSRGLSHVSDLMPSLTYSQWDGHPNTQADTHIWLSGLCFIKCQSDCPSVGSKQAKVWTKGRNRMKLKKKTTGHLTVDLSPEGNIDFCGE